jgi:aspartate-semialdehyde dehydrogenase
MKIVVVGATGMVGEVMLQVLAERNFISDADELILVARKIC